MRKKMYIICFFALAMFFTSIYYASYSYSIKNNTGENIITNRYVEEDDTQVRSVNGENQPIVKNSAVCVLQDYNLTNDWMSEKEYSVPMELIGMTRDEVITYINNYMADMKEEEKSMTKYELISFATDKLVIRKSFKTEEDLTYTYWLQTVAGKLIVYKADRVTIYIQTDIEMDKLPEEEQESLKEGKYIIGVQELFNYLESCTT